LEVPFEIECQGPRGLDAATAVSAAWDWCLTGEGQGTVERSVQHLTVMLEGSPETAPSPSRVVARDVASLLHKLSPVVTRLAITERRDDLIMFHACAVADPETGATIVLYGPSGTGKTTLARTLCTELVYLSDETAGIAPDLRVVPYLKPLSILVKSGDRIKEQVSPGRLGLLRPGQVSFRLHSLVQLHRDPEHRGDAVLERLATVDALPELMAQTSFTRHVEHPLQQMAALAHRVGGVQRVRYAEAEQLRPVLRTLLDGDG
jgi:hypothetical protein